MTAERIRLALEEIAEEELVYVRASDGAIVWDSRIPRRWPDIDIDRLTMLVSDNLWSDDTIDWRAVTLDYQRDVPTF